MITIGKKMFFLSIIEKVEHFHLSRKAKEAIKVGLSFSLVIAVACQLGWMNPYWASLAVGQIALFPAGQSLNNGALRIVGTIYATIASLIIYALAPQERWIFAALTAGWMMFTTYMMIKDAKVSYLWNTAGFAALAILATHQSSSATIFYSAMARSIETIMAIIVYTLVTVFIWPDSNIASLKRVATDLISVQTRIFGLLDSLEDSTKVKRSFQATVKQGFQLLTAFQQALYAKGSETFEVQQVAEFWTEFYGLSRQLEQSLNRLYNSNFGLKTIVISNIVPNLDEYRQEVIRRFGLAEDILQKGTREFKIKTVVLDVDEAYLKNLSPFDQVAFASRKEELEKVEKLSRKILKCVSNIMDDSVHKKVTEPRTHVSIYERFTPDLEHLKSVFFIGSFTFVCFCIWFFVDPPGHMLWMQLPPTIAMLVAATPQMKTNKMVVPCFFIYSFFLMVNMHIMPQLSSFTQLGPLLFICMFCVFYFATGVYKVLSVIAITTKLMVSNEQTYDFAASFNMIIWSVSTYAVLYAFSYMLSSPRPQKAVLSLIRRYFKSAEYLASESQNNEKKGGWKKIKTAFYSYELRTLPLKIRSWSQAINHKNYPKNSPHDIDELLINILSLSYSIEEWISSNRLPQTKHMLSDTKKELGEWNKGIKNVFQDYYNDLDSSLSVQVEEVFNRHIFTLESIVNKNKVLIKQLDVTAQERENLYRLMGSYQGLSLSLISYAAAAEQINWKHWQEEVFA